MIFPEDDLRRPTAAWFLGANFNRTGFPNAALPIEAMGRMISAFL
jgi:hypothetical protein